MGFESLDSPVSEVEGASPCDVASAARLERNGVLPGNADGCCPPGKRNADFAAAGFDAVAADGLAGAFVGLAAAALFLNVDGRVAGVDSACAVFVPVPAGAPADGLDLIAG